MALDSAKLQKPLRKVRKLLNKFPKNPSPELVHNLRTQTRRIEAMLDALRLDLSPNGRRVRKELAPVHKQAGRVRDMDVLTGFSAGLHRNPEEEQCLIEVLEYLGAERYRKCRKLRGLVWKHKRRIRRDLKRLSRFLNRGLRKARQKPTSGSEWPIDAAASALELSNELAQWAALKAANLHPYRLKVKELLYVLQLSDKADQGFTKSLIAVKDEIGEWHDWQQLGTIAEKVLGRKAKSDLLKRIRTITGEKFQRALAITNQMRRRYLERGSNGRQKRNRRTFAASPNPPIVMAIASLAA
jgi:CHAD domain-containing protein